MCQSDTLGYILRFTTSLQLIQPAASFVSFSVSTVSGSFKSSLKQKRPRKKKKNHRFWNWIICLLIFCDNKLNIFDFGTVGWEKDLQTITWPIRSSHVSFGPDTSQNKRLMESSVYTEEAEIVTAVLPDPQTDLCAAVQPPFGGYI